MSRDWSYFQEEERLGMGQWLEQLGDLNCLKQYSSFDQRNNIYSLSAQKVQEIIGSKKFRIREKKHLSTDADSSTDAIGGWTKNTPKPDFFEKRKKSFKTKKNSKMSRNMPKLAIRPSTRGL